MSFRLSPNEEAAVLRQERDRRRKLRIQQVREQERQFARKVRSDVRQRKSVELKVLSEQLEDNWVKEQNEKTHVLKQIFEKNLEHIGEGHRAAAEQEPQDGKRAVEAALNKKAARHRHNIALDRLRNDQDEQKQKENAHILSRLTALEIEKGRAAKIASLAPPVMEKKDEVKPMQPVKCVQDFSTTHYHVPTEYVEKAEPHEQGDAKAAAVEEQQRLKEEHQEAVRESQEQREKAILRHKHAHNRELLEQDMGRLMEELGQLEQADRRRRQAVVAKIPHQVFQPPHRRLEEREEHQLNLEQAFEDMYMANTEFTGDLTLALEPRVPQHDADLDLTTESSVSEPGVTLQPAQGSAALGQEGTQHKPLSRSETLQKLMKRIQGQRDDWREKSVHDLSTAQVAGVASQKDSKQPTHNHAEATQPPLDTESTETLTSSDGSKVGKDKTSELSEHPIPSDLDNGKASLTDETMSEPIISGSPTIMHPMELAAKLRASSKFPDMSQLKRDQEQLMKKEEEQRQQLARQQLDTHTEQHKHLQALQRNLEERQHALSRQIKQHEVDQMYTRHTQHPHQVLDSDPRESQSVMEPPHGDVETSPPRILRSDQEVSSNVHFEPDRESLEQHRRNHPDGQRESAEHSLQPQNSISMPKTSADLPVTDLARTSENVTLPPQLEPVTSDYNSRQQRIRDYQLQLITQQRQSRNTLLEAQARLQQRRLNLLKEYPELKLPDYSPYVSKLMAQQPNVIYSQAEKESSPVSITSDDYTAACGRQQGLQVPRVDHPISRQTEYATIPFTGPQEHHVDFHHENTPAIEERLEDNVQYQLLQRAHQMTSQSRSPDGDQHHAVMNAKLPQEPPETNEIMRLQDIHITHGDQTTTMHSESVQPEQPLVYGRSHEEPTPSHEQNIFRDFLREQKEKLELKNKEQQERLKLKQEQLREQIKRQMEQYRDNFMQQRGEDGATETTTPLIQPSHETHISGTNYFSQFHPLSARLHESHLPQMIQVDDQAEPIPSNASYQSKSHHRPPPPSRIITNQDEIQLHPHELSTIMEVDTPKSERKSLVSRPLEASRQSTVLHDLPGDMNYQLVGSQDSNRDQSDMNQLFEVDNEVSPQSLTPYAFVQPLLPDSPDAAIPVWTPPIHGSTLHKEHSFLQPLSTKDGIGEINNQFGNTAAEDASYHFDRHPVKPQIASDHGEVNRHIENVPSGQDVRIPDHRMTGGDGRVDAWISKSSRTSFENTPDSTYAAGRHLTGAAPVETSRTLVTGGVSTSRESVAGSRIHEDGRFAMYSYDVGRGVITYPTSKPVIPSSITRLPASSHSAPPTTPQIYGSRDSQSILPSNLPELHTPSLTVPFSLQSTTQQAIDSIDPSTSKPIIEVFQPTLDVTPYTATELPQDDWHFSLLQRRSIGSGSSSPSETPENNNAPTPWTMPKTTDMSGFRIGPLFIGGEAQEGSSPSSNSSCVRNTNSNAAPQQRTVSTNEMQWVHEQPRALSNSNILVNDALQRMRMDIDKDKSAVIKWKDILTEGDNTTLTDQSQMSLLSEHSLSQSITVPAASIHTPGDRRQYGNIQIARVTDGADPELQDVAEEGEANLTQHPVTDSPGMQMTGQQIQGMSEKRLYMHASNLSKPMSSPTKGHDSLELSEHTLDPTYSSFLQLQTSSQITEPNEVPRSVPYNQHVSDQAVFGEPSGLPTDVHSPEAELSQHRVGMISDGQEFNSQLNPSHSRHDPSKDSLSSIEEARYQCDQDNVNYQLMPMFSDVSISQRSVSFGSEKDQEGQRPSNITIMSDRYSLPRTYHEGTNLETGFNTEQGLAMFQRWHDGIPQFVGQTSGDSSGNQFYPLHEITSSTQQGDQHTASVDTGIMEEPDLTLVSLNTTECSILPDTQPDERELRSDGNLVSSDSQLIDVEMSNISSEAKENIQPTAMSDGSPVLSLQEAFTRRKAGFIQASKTRLDEAKVRAKDQAASAISTTIPQNRTKAARSQTSANISKPTIKNASKPRHQPKKDKSKVVHENKSETSQASSSSQTSSKSQRSKIRTSTRGDRKAAEKEMYKRTGRLYNQLEEVKQKKLETERKEQYSANRQRKKEFQQKLQTRLSKWSKQKNDT